MPSAAEMISVLSISPTTISVVCALRRGMLRTPSLKMTGRRQATSATNSRQSASRTRQTDHQTGHRETKDIVHLE